MTTDAKRNYEIDPSLANDILAWAQTQIDTIPDDVFQDDWWGQYSPDWDVNIWVDEPRNGGYINVTVYPIVRNGDEVETDYSRYNRVGTIDVALWNYDFEPCGSCSAQMNKKYESTYPHRHPELGVICGNCWNEEASSE